MLRCSIEAYEKCPDRQYCGPFEAAVFCEGSECDQFNLFVELAPGLPASFFYDNRKESEEAWRTFLRYYGVEV